MAPMHICRVFALVVAALTGLLSAGSARSDPAETRFPALNNEDAWKTLPRENPPLPVWARSLAGSLPKTTAAMLELDYLHRAKNPLGAAVYGKLRWVAADTLGCAYSKSRAEADLKRAGLSDADLKALAADRKAFPESERLALEFARKMSRAAYEVTDEEMAALLKQFGPEKVVAIVHTLAHANFQDRIFLALGIETEARGHLPPFDFRTDSEKKDRIVTPARPVWKDTLATTATVPNAQPNWLDHRYDDLQRALGQQKARQPRIPLPAPDALAKLPAETRERTMRIVWSHVSMGYQPLLTRAWFDCMSTFQKEADFDKVFSNTFFWVVTRSNDCFY